MTTHLQSLQMAFSPVLTKKYAMSGAVRGGFGGGGARSSGEVALVGAGEDPAVGLMLAGDCDRGGAACSLDSSLLSLPEIGSSKLNTSSDDESCDLSVRPPCAT
jgi:hypothetical protein